MSTAPASAVPGSEAEPYHVMVVDDSAVIRGFFRRALESDPSIKVVASAGNGQYALDNMIRHEIDVIVLDIEMPVMDGMTALPKLLAKDPTVKVIMASTLTEKNADISLQAMSNGAADYIPKPSTANEIHSAQGFKRELIEKVKALGMARRGPATRAPRAGAVAAPAVGKAPLASPIALCTPSTATPTVLAIGSSTGGPQALMKMVVGLGKDFALPIFITQHMPVKFTAILAEHLGSATGCEAAEGVDGEVVKPGRIYVAPGDHHMLVERRGAEVIIRVTSTEPENYCRPAVDPMLRSIAEVYRDKALSVILTGMGHDGTVGGQAIVDAGGTVLVQDEATSVVWGMPGAAAAAGVCAAVLPLEKIAAHVRKLSGR
jgi:two-component system chemotaxis response regulator CheB